MNGSSVVSEDGSINARKHQIRNGERYIDLPMLVVLAMILIFGLAMIYSTSSYRARDLYSDDTYFFRRQAIYMFIAVLGMIIVSRIDHMFFFKYSKVILWISLLLQILVLVIGTASHGSSRWLYIGPIGFQPSEYAKLAITVYTAAQAAVKSRDLCRFGCLLKVMALPVLTIVLIGIENLSTAIICFGIMFVILFVASPGIKHFIVIGLCGIVGCVLFILFAGYRADRVRIWLAPEQYADGYQTVQSLYAVGSGGLFGLGYGKSVQKQGFIPESHNDMIFSVVCEELGIVGAIFLIVIFAVFMYRLVIIAMNADNRFGSLVSIGVMAHVAVQLLINMGVVTNTIPPTGVPMPFISYGGSSIIFILAEIGIVMSVCSAHDSSETSYDTHINHR